MVVRHDLSAFLNRYRCAHALWTSRLLRRILVRQSGFVLQGLACDQSLGGYFRGFQRAHAGGKVGPCGRPRVGERQGGVVQQCFGVFHEGELRECIGDAFEGFEGAHGKLEHRWQLFLLFRVVRVLYLQSFDRFVYVHVHARLRTAHARIQRLDRHRRAWLLARRRVVSLLGHRCDVPEADGADIGIRCDGGRHSILAGSAVFSRDVLFHEQVRRFGCERHHADW
mmetsp:Transcript_59076/g.165061  ORF Transcript_59076/g.165061 Transcript_59076/m.165061 type:complete len:225 (+) Transcript_59076:745-1419(+)